MFRLLCLVIGYALGCIQTAFILGKIFSNIDIRQYGSGNAGTTNVVRVLGWKAGVITFIGDLIKAILAVTLCRLIFPDNPLLAALYGGLGVILGHNWPFYLGFKGGKGIASTIGTMLAIHPYIGLTCIAIMVLVIVVTRFVSLGSLLLALAIPVLIGLLHQGDQAMLEGILIGLIFTVSAFVQHRANITRLLRGTESKLGQRSNKKVEDEYK